MRTNRTLQVCLGDAKVGVLAMAKDNRIAFAYDEEWLRTGFSISPFSLPLQAGVFLPKATSPEGLFGVFTDSLPDAWGHVLVNRMLKKQGVAPESVTSLDRLSIVGDTGMGALCYRPEMCLPGEATDGDLDRLAEECKKILQSQPSEDLDELYRLGGTSGGARPKVMMEVEGEEWIIKFPAHVDGEQVGVMEYDYSLCAKECGITMTETRLFTSEQCGGYFGTKRFDRVGLQKKRVHMLTAAALLELDYREPNLDYHDLMKLTKILTRDSKEAVAEMFRRMCFNVFAHNLDDHSKNFAFLYGDDGWRLAPAYDLTHSTTYYGEHTTSVDGNGTNPSDAELLRVGLAAGMKQEQCREIIETVREVVERRLARYLREY